MKRNKMIRKIVFGILMFTFSCLCGIFAQADSFDELRTGSYPLEASLSCYINAMGGVEFGAPMLKSAQLTVAEDGSKQITMKLQKSAVNIYSVTCDTFIDPSPTGAVAEGSVPSGTIGYYDEANQLITSGVSYTMSSDTAMNSKQEAVPYVDSITFPVERENSEFALALYINSNVMGTQFSNEKNPAFLRVNWASLYAQSHEPEPETKEEVQEIAQVPKETVVSAQAVNQESESLAEVQEKREAAAVESKSVEAAAETSAAEASKERTEVKAMDGLNLYQAEQSEASVQEEVITAAQADGYFAYFDKTVLAVVGTASVMFIVMGVVFVFIGSREEKKYAQ